VEIGHNTPEMAFAGVSRVRSGILGLRFEVPVWGMGLTVVGEERGVES